MDIQSAIRAVTEHRDLSGEEMTSVMRAIMSGEATQSQIGGFLIGLRMKGETVEEIAAAATVMRELATPVHVQAEHLVDTCGTGGDGSGTFNISTASAFVAAGAGAKVAKHGNRSASSSSGSADVLEAACVNLDLRVLAQLGSRHVLVVHSEDGLDEISIGAESHIAEARDGRVHTHSINPGRFGMETADISTLTVASPKESLEAIRAVFDNTDGPARDIVALNAGAAIYASGLAGDLNAGVAAAMESLSSGAARERLARLVALSNSF
jgi:anthranilate phosphoribosyltransferase